MEQEPVCWQFLQKNAGASKVIAIDNDEWSIHNAIENIEANNCKNILLKQQNDLQELTPADIVLANINLNVLNNESASIHSLLKPGGLLLVSGFLVKDEKEMENIFEEKNFVKRKRWKRDGLAGILFEKQ